MEQMRDQAVNVGTKLVNDTIKSVDLESRPFKAIGDGGEVYTADTVVILSLIHI